MKKTLISLALIAAFGSAMAVPAVTTTSTGVGQVGISNTI